MRVPRSTYRLQITAAQDLRAASGLLGYLHDLGVDWVYLSPLLAAEPGSDHGYDVVAHDHIDGSRGGAEGLAALSAEAKRLGMGVLVDIVPNHVGVATPAENAWWWDLLTHGRGSAYADTFDVDWAAGDGRILIPIVGDGDEASITVDAAAGELTYHEHRLPLAPGTTSHDEQHYRLVSWRAADDRLNYRRFFAVNTLAGVRVEDRAVFDATHAEIGRWFDAGLADGIRVDHPDGLRDPRGYLDDLARVTGGAYTLVEKILEPGEALPADWATQGTTGYDALGVIDRVLTDPGAEAPLAALDTRLRGHEQTWSELVHDAKRDVADGILGSEVRRIVRELPDLGVPSEALVDAVAEVVTCFGVYRSYLPEGRDHLDEALAGAREHRPDLAEVLDTLAPVLADPAQPAALRLQQTSGMVMAKGVEDCSFYRWTRLGSLTEVGGDPSEHSLDVDGFHAFMARRQSEWPDAMTTTTTHDTKRGEDVRARIAVLAEMPAQWADALERLLDLAPLPDRAFGSLLWQAIVGAWPAEPDPDLRARLHGYAEKAMREAGDRTTWTAPDEPYEAAVHAAVDAALDDAEVVEVLDGLRALVDAPGAANGLALKLLALTIPGVPDVYQGSELWEQSLVDPDNRRPVDFDLRRRLLDSAEAPAKLRLTAAALRLRRDRPELFEAYSPVAPSGEAADHVVAFDRGGALAVATRLPLGLEARGGWGATVLELPPGRWRDALSSAEHSGSPAVTDVLRDAPVALLVREDA